MVMNNKINTNSDSISNLEFNLKTIKRNKGLRGVIFKETRELFKLLDKGDKRPQWEQLIELIEMQIEIIKNKE